MILATLRIFLLLIIGIVGMPLSGLAQDCFICHEPGDFTGKVVHPPVAQGDCGACHSPHVSRYEGLLRKQESELCYTCHTEIFAQVEKKQFQHRPVQQGQCSSCHAPHAAERPGLLTLAGGALCYSCHEQAQTNYQYFHQPFQQGTCSVCHTPHASDDSRLLKQSGNRLCLSCHKPSAKLRKAHLGRELAEIDCLACHHPHGGAEPTLLRAVSHQPFAEGDCQGCHGQNPGAELCLNCHQDSLNSFYVIHSHLGVGGPTAACTVCHNPHVGDRPGLLPANEGRICRRCHEDTFQQREQMLHKHQGWNQCTDCHLGHGANNPAMLKQGSDVCSQCHEQHKSFSHPMGEAALDPRNSRPMDCLTCHDANTGTMFQHFLRGSGERGLCVQCHQSY